MRSTKLLERYFSDKLIKNSLFILFSSLYNLGSGFIFWIIAAKLYTVNEVGLSTALISSLGLVILLSRLGLDMALVRFLPKNNQRSVFESVLIITTLATITISIIYIVLFKNLFLNENHTLKIMLIIIFIFISIANSVALVTGNLFLAERSGKEFFYQNLLMGIRIPLLLPLVFLGSIGIFGSFGISYGLAAIFAFIMMNHNKYTFIFRVNKEFIHEALNYSFLNYISSVLGAAPSLLIPIIILDVLGDAEAAKYYISFSIGNLLLFAPLALSRSLLVEGSYGENLKRNAIKAIIASMLILAPGIIVLFLLGDSILGLLRAEYTDAFWLLRIFALSSIFLMAYSFFLTIQNIRMKVLSITKIEAIKCILLLGLSYPLILSYGINGAGLAWAATYALITIIITIIALKEKWI